MQKVVIGLLGVVFLMMIYAYGAALFGSWTHWAFIRVAHVVEHIAVMLYIARIFIADQERRCLPSLSRNSRR